MGGSCSTYGDVSLPSPEDRSRPSFRAAVFSRYLEFRTIDKSTNPAILNIIHHRQNPLHYTHGVSDTRRIQGCRISSVFLRAFNEIIREHR
jgi:hypothetical protein